MNIHGNYKSENRKKIGGIPVQKEYNYLGVMVKNNYDLSANLRPTKVSNAHKTAAGIQNIFAPCRNTNTQLAVTMSLAWSKVAYALNFTYPMSKKLQESSKSILKACYMKAYGTKQMVDHKVINRAFLN
jgi:hypothetical protein